MNSCEVRVPKWTVRPDRQLFADWRELQCDISVLMSIVQNEEIILTDDMCKEFHEQGQAARNQLDSLLRKTSRALRPRHAVRECEHHS